MDKSEQILLKCPLCGGNAVYYVDHKSGTTAAGCPECGIKTKPYIWAELATKAWNRRAK